MKIVISGATGFVGSLLTPFLETNGHQVLRLIRSPVTGSGSTATWDPGNNRIDAAALDGAEAVIHLSGENIGQGRWTARKKARIRDSRVKSTQLLASTLASLPSPPGVLMVASAIGFYGDRGDEILDEKAPAGTGFLAAVCREWEAAADVARQIPGIRVVHLRFGVILGPGGALAKMLTPFRLGLGGRLGSGRQYMSWISRDEIPHVVAHLLDTSTVSGPVNVVAPEPITNLDFTSTLGRAVRRPTLFPMPALAARLALGEMADALLLASTRVVPNRLAASGYRFRHADLEGVLRRILAGDRE